MFNALAEAAYMTGLERNGDVVEFASYAPLLAKIGNTQWNPDLIYFDNKAVYPTVNYYVQQLFSVNKGNMYFENIITHQDKKNKELASSCVQDLKTGDVILKLVNPSAETTTMTVDLKPFKRIFSDAVLTVFSGDKDAENTKDKNLVLPVRSDFKATRVFDYKLPAYSIAVIRIKTKK